MSNRDLLLSLARAHANAAENLTKKADALGHSPTVALGATIILANAAYASALGSALLDEAQSMPRDDRTIVRPK